MVGGAALIDLAGTWLAHPAPGRALHSENVEFDADHMIERCRLFLLIALGETVLTTGTAIAGASMTLMTVVTGASALVGTVALWALGFGRAGRLTLQYVEATSDPVRASRRAGDTLTVMVAGLIAVAVANEEVIAHPREPGSVVLSVLVYGGPTLFLVAQGWYFWVVLHARPRLHLIGSIALLLGGLATFSAPRAVASLFVAASLSAMAILDRP